MATTLIKFPISSIVDGILSYLQHLFATPDLTPSDYRWDPDDRKSRIRICAPFVIDSSKPMSAPFIVVERGGFQYDDRIIDNVKSGDANVMSNMNKVSICDGHINIICGSRVASEASTLANFISMMFQADRHGIIKTLKFVRNFKHVDVSPEIPVVKDSEVRRWEVTVRVFASLQEGWIVSNTDTILLKKAGIYVADHINDDKPFSDKGEIETGVDLLIDQTKDFGPYLTNNPQILEQELEKGWYYIRFTDNAYNQLYNIAEIVNSHTLRLTTHDVNDTTVPWISTETKINVGYDLLWNDLHLHTEIKVEYSNSLKEKHMANYQGPNASVTQQFVVSPGAVAVENLPSVAVATAYDVHQQESMADFFGINSETVVPWGTDNKVVYDKNVAGLKAFEMFPPKAYANTKYGNIDLGILHDGFTEVGVKIDRDTSYVVPGTEKIAGSCQGIIPYYKADLVSEILASDLQTVIITNGDVITAQIKPGQKVFIYDGGYQLVGTVGSISSDKTKILLATPYTAAITGGTKILVGAENGTTLHAYANTLFDPTADFVTAKVAVGDVINFSSLAISGSIDAPKQASVTAVVNKNTLRFNTKTPDTGEIDYSFSGYYPQVAFDPMGSTISLYSYSVNRLLGFGQSYGLKKFLHEHDGTTTTTSGPNVFEGVTIKSIVSPTMFQIYKEELTYVDQATTILNKGDIFAVNDVRTEYDWKERDPLSSSVVMRFYKIDTITFIDTGVPANDYYIITTTEPIYLSNTAEETLTAIQAGDYIDAWKPMVETEILADFRAIRAQEHNVVKRIASVQDIFTAWVRSEETTIDPRNELAFMMNIILSRSGGKVCYGINVDSSSNNLSAEYAEAFEELKLKDVYSHCFGTTDAGVNGSIGSYCDDQSAPYEAHERIGTICYDTDDLILMGSDSCVVDGETGEVTVNGALNLLTAGVTVKDQVKLYDADGLYITTATVVETPSTSTIAVTDYRGAALVTNNSARFQSGRKDDQAVRIGSINYGNRRVTQIFPGWFYAEFDGTRMILPPYFIAAALVGMDSGVLVSQPLTNTTFSIPGLSNIELNTSTYFRKAQLDVIGGSGVDIMIQDTTISQSIKSRHDLTTNMDAVQYRERSITKQADVCAKTIRNAVNPYVGRYNINDKNLFRFLGQVCSIVCSKLINDTIIFNISVTSIKRDEVIDDKVNFSVEATAYIAANYYDITLLVKTR
jgi:hypothetical protein